MPCSPPEDCFVPRTGRRFWVPAIRIGLGLAILIWVFSKLPLDEFAAALRQGALNWQWWIVGLLSTGMGLVGAAIRWKRLLQAQQVDLAPTRTLRLFFIGQFFNSFLPGSCGGDAARVYYVFRETQLKRTEAMTTVLVDRGIGFLTLVFFACGMLAWQFTYVVEEQWARLAGILMLAILLGSTIVLIAAFHQHLFERWPRLADTLSRWRLGPVLLRAYSALYVYRDRPAVLGMAVLLSLLNLTGLTLACYAFGRSLGLDVSLLYYFTLFPVITALSSIPITPGAFGVREGLFVQLFAIPGVSAAGAVSLSLMVYGGGLAWSLFGGLLFINYTARFGVSWRDEWRKLQDQALP